MDSSLTPYLHTKKDGSFSISILAQPNASSTGLAGIHGGALKVRLQCPPVDGRANKALVAFFAKLLGVPKSSLRISRGLTSRSKTLEIQGVDIQHLRSILKT